MVKSKTKIGKQIGKKNNPILVETLIAAKKTNSEFWLKVAAMLSGPRRSKIAVNLDQIARAAKEGDSFVVPGKILSQGETGKKIAIAAMAFSEKARERLLKSKSQTTTILEEIKKNPQGQGLKIFTGEQND